MKGITYISAQLLTLLTVATVQAISEGFKTPETPAFSRYEGILNRMPFGAAPPPQAAAGTLTDARTTAQDLKDQQLLARQINMSCVNITPSGIAAVGFTDMAEKPPANYYLLVGDDANGWTVKSADYEEEWAELEKEGTTIFVKLGQGLMAEPPKKTVPEKSSLAKNSKILSADSEKAEEDSQKTKPPVFKTITEQMLALAASTPPGALPVPLPVVAINENDLVAAMETKQEISEKDTNRTSVYKEVVEEEKEKLAKHIIDEGGSPESYLERKQNRQIEEYERHKATQQAALEQLEELARKITTEELEKRRAEINKELEAEGVEPIY
jgi:hypothetical protein